MSFDIATPINQDQPDTTVAGQELYTAESYTVLSDQETPETGWSVKEGDDTVCDVHHGGEAMARQLSTLLNQQRAPRLDVRALAQEIRRIDGGHKMGAGMLAEALMPFLEATPQPEAPATESDPGLLAAVVGELYAALPYVTDCEDSTDFKPGVVKKQVKRIQAVLKRAELVGA